MEAVAPPPAAPAAAPPTSARKPRTIEGAGWFAVTATMLCGIAPVLLIGSTKLGVKDASIDFMDPAGVRFSHPAWWVALVVLIVIGLRFSWVVATHPQRF